MNSQAIARSERPRTRSAIRRGVACAARSASERAFWALSGITGLVVEYDARGMRRSEAPRSSRLPPLGRACARSTDRLIVSEPPLLAEHARPVADQEVERLARRAVAGDDVVVHPPLHGE